MTDVPPGARLDSWKAIAEYLGRDLATVRRWEKTLGLPVRRVAGTGRSVFAYASDIDEWLRASRSGFTIAEAGVLPVPETPPAAIIAPTVTAAATAVPRFRRWAWLGATAVLLALVGAVVVRTRAVAARDLRVEISNTGVIARDSRGVERWRYKFPADHKTFLPAVPSLVVGGTSPGVFFATFFRGHQTDGERVEGGALTLLDLDGRPLRSFSFDDQVTFQGRTYGQPWAVTAFAVDEAKGTRRIAVAAHHYFWDPGLVTILDDQWQRRGTFVHAGWIEQVRWLGPERLLIGGFSNAHDGGMIALLDPASLDGQGPEPASSPHFCNSCGTGGPLRMFVFPRTELNRVTASRFNRVVVTTLTERLVAQTIEVPSPDGDATAVYEFGSSLDLVSARFNERYWEMHRMLEADGKITHSREQCPGRDGPRQVQMWEPATGWRTLQVDDIDTF